MAEVSVGPRNAPTKVEELATLQYDALTSLKEITGKYPPSHPLRKGFGSDGFGGEAWVRKELARTEKQISALGAPHEEHRDAFEKVQTKKTSEQAEVEAIK